MDRYLSCEFHAYLPYSAGGCQQYLLSQRRRKVLKSGEEGGHCMLKWVLCGHFLGINIHQRIKKHEILDCDLEILKIALQQPKADWCVVDSPIKQTNEFVLFAFLLFTAKKKIRSFFWRISGAPILLSVLSDLYQW